MGTLDCIDKAQIRDILGKGWLTHDGMWFLHVCREFGIEQANALNRAAIKSMAPIEVQRARSALGFNETIDTFEKVRDFLLSALELTLPRSVREKMRLSARANGILHWEWESEECFAYKGMKQMGVLEEYRCGVMYRIECWLGALNIPYEIRPRLEQCIMHRSGSCEGDIRVFFQGS